MQIVGQSLQYPNTNPFAGGSISLLITPPTQSPGANVYLGCFTGNYTVGSLSNPEIILGRQVVNGNYQPYIQMLSTIGTYGAGPALFMYGGGNQFNVDTYQNTFNTSLPTTFSGNVTSARLTATQIGVNNTSPAYPFDVNGQGRFVSNGANQVYLVNTSTANQQDACEIGFDRSAGLSTARSAIGVGAGGRNAYWWVNGGDRINIDPNGRVGINVQSPNYTLDVNGNFKTSFLYANGGSLSGIYNLGQNDNNGFTWGPNTNSKICDNGDLRIATDDNMHFYTGCNNSTYGTEYLTIANGCVGVNKPSPSYGLDIVGSVQWTSGSSYLRSNGGYTQWYRGDSNAGDGLHDYYSDVGGTQVNVARITCSGAWYNKTGTYNTLSDKRKKKNIVDARSYLDSICKLKVRKYSWIDSDDGDKPSQLGFIAQEVQDVMPGLVDTMEWGDLKDFKSLKTTILIPMLVSAVQTLAERLAALERSPVSAADTAPVSCPEAA